MSPRASRSTGPSTDSSDIDNAIMAKLGADADLLALCPNGVYWDEAPPGATRFVIVSLVAADDTDQFGGTAYEDILYAISARMLLSAAGDIKAAAYRIDALLAEQPLTVAGYTWMACYRETRIRLTEVDDVDISIRWQHRGGNYRVQMSINP
jgi:hypothetical protein